jgi:hypothetical protein
MMSSRSLVTTLAAAVLLAVVTVTGFGQPKLPREEKGPSLEENRGQVLIINYSDL